MARRSTGQLFTAEWFPYYFERFEQSGRVAMLSLSEEGAYHRAIRFAWKYGSVPSDPEQLAAVIQKRCTVAIARRILQHFETMPGVPSRAIHPTVEEIREEQEAKFLSSRERGLLGAEARWGKKDVPSSEEGVPPPKKPPKNGSAMAEPMQDLDKRVETKDSDSESFSETDASPACVRERVAECLKAYPDIDPRIVELGTIKVLITHRSNPDLDPIKNIARYCREEIESLATQAEKKLASKTIDAMLHSHRLKAEKYLTSE